MIAGIDLSTKAVEIVRRVDGEADAYWLRVPCAAPPKHKEPDALAARELARVFPRGDFWDGVWLCGVEYPFAGGKAGFQSVGLKTIMGAVLALIPDRVHVIALPANYWQGRFCERGKSLGYKESMPTKSIDRKPLIAARALELLKSDDIWPQDAYDAFGISWVVEAVNDGTAR